MGIRRISPANFTQVTQYGVSEKTEQIDYDALAKTGRRSPPGDDHRRRLGLSADHRFSAAATNRRFSRRASVHRHGAHRRVSSPADNIPARFRTRNLSPRPRTRVCADRAAASCFARRNSPKQIDSTVFPGVQGGPLMHVIAAKAVCFHEALQPQFREYQRQVVLNAKALAAGLAKHGFRIVSGGTDNHLMLVDLRPKEINGKEAQEVLDRAGITVNKNAIPFDTYPIFKPGGIRIGTPAVTTRGMKEEEMLEIADLIAEALANRIDADALEKVHRRVLDLTRRFPLPI